MFTLAYTYRACYVMHNELLTHFTWGADGMAKFRTAAWPAMTPTEPPVFNVRKRATLRERKEGRENGHPNF